MKALKAGRVNVLLNKSNCFKNVEVRVVWLIVTLFHLTALTNLMYYFNLLYYWSNWTEHSEYFSAHFIIIC